MRAIVCPALCRYYKPDRPDPEGCGGINWLEARPELESALAGLETDKGNHLFGLDRDHPRLAAICQACAFRVDGCDFRDPEVADEDCAPCGGLRAVAALMAQGALEEQA